MTRNKTLVLLVAACAVAAFSVVSLKLRPASRTPPPARIGAESAFGRMPLAFEKNLGQHDPRARFVARGDGGAVFLSSSGVRFALAGSRSPGAGPHQPPGSREREASPRAPSWFEVTFPGARDVAPVGERELPGKANYFIGNDPGRWRTNVPTFERVRFPGVYAGVDLVFYGNGRVLEYDFELEPRADPGLVRIAYGHVDGMTVDEAGDLHLALGGREVLQRRPRVYQDVDGERREVGSAYAVAASGEVKITLAKYERERPLIVDPAIVYSSYLGGSGDDFASKIAVDGAGNAYATGYTPGLGFPTASAYQPTPRGQYDAFVTKMAADGKSLVYSTYLGGTAYDQANGIAVDASGNAYVTGSTSSIDFPTVSAYQAARAGGTDAFVAKLAANGALLVYSTYLGGLGSSAGNGIAVDGSENALVAGYTTSSAFPVANAYQSNNAGGFDAFVAKLAASGSLVYSTYLGGSSTDYGNAIAVDGLGNAYVTGYTSCPGFPVANAFQSICAGGNDAFVTKVAADGRSLVYSTYLGGTLEDSGSGIAVDGSGNAYVTGHTYAASGGAGDFPCANAYQATPGGVGRDAFVTKLAASGSSLLYSTYLGGSDEDSGSAIAVDGSGAAYVTGYTFSADFPAVTPSQAGNPKGYWGMYYDDLDCYNGCPVWVPTAYAFVTKVASNGASLAYSTHLGGSGEDRGNGIAVNGSGDAYVVGQTTSANFPTVSAFQATSGGGLDVFLARISPLAIAAVTPSSGNPAGGTAVTIQGQAFVSGTTVLFDTTPAAGVSVVSATSINAITPAHGAGTVNVSVRRPDGATASLSNAFTYVLAPAISAIAPVGGPLAGGNSVAIGGVGFAPGAQVRFGTAGALAVTVVSATSITATAPPHAAGSVDVVVTNPDGQFGTLAGGYLYAAAPTVASVSPIGGPPAGGTTVTLTGTGFGANATVTFAGASATSSSVVSSTSITATAPPHAAGAVDVVVTNVDGQSGTLAGGFTYAPPPVLSLVSPSSGPSTGGTAVTLVGSGFAPGAAVTFGGTSGSGVTFNNSTSLTVAAPPHAAGAVDVTVSNPDQQSSTITAAFEYQASGGGGGQDTGTATAGSKDLFASSCSHAGGAGWLSLAFLALLPVRRRRPAHCAIALLACLLPALALAQVARPAADVAVPRKQADKRERVALLPIRAGIGIDPKLPEAAADSLAAAISRRGVSVVSLRDVEAALGFERQRQLMGCSSDSSCLAEIGGALGVDRIISGGLARFGKTLVLTVQLLDARKATVIRRAEARLKASAQEELLDAVDRASFELFPAGTGDSSGARVATSSGVGSAASFGIGLRLSGNVTALGGAAAMLAEYHPTRALCLALGPAVTASGVPGALVRIAWTPLRFGRRFGLVLAAEGTGYDDRSVIVAGAAASVGLDVAVTRNFALAFEVPALYLVAAPDEYRKLYVTPGMTAGWKF